MFLIALLILACAGRRGKQPTQLEACRNLCQMSFEGNCLPRSPKWLIKPGDTDAEKAAKMLPCKKSFVIATHTFRGHYTPCTVNRGGVCHKNVNAAWKCDLKTLDEVKQMCGGKCYDWNNNQFEIPCPAKAIALEAIGGGGAPVTPVTPAANVAPVAPVAPVVADKTKPIASAVTLPAAVKSPVPATNTASSPMDQLEIQALGVRSCAAGLERITDEAECNAIIDATHHEKGSVRRWGGRWAQCYVCARCVPNAGVVFNNRMGRGGQLICKPTGLSLLPPAGATCGDGNCDIGEIKKGCFQDCATEFLNMACALAKKNDICDEKCPALVALDSTLYGNGICGGLFKTTQTYSEICGSACPAKAVPATNALVQNLASDLPTSSPTDSPTPATNQVNFMDTFEIGDMGVRSCMTGYEPITDEAECLKIIDATHHVRGSVRRWGGRWARCYYCAGCMPNKGVVFNNRMSRRGQLICKKIPATNVVVQNLVSDLPTSSPTMPPTPGLSRTPTAVVTPVVVPAANVGPVAPTHDCCDLKAQYGIVPFNTWGKLRDRGMKRWWNDNNCNKAICSNAPVAEDLVADLLGALMNSEY